ncbi:MAG TPA: hypothetical protein VIL44_11810 [Micromonospora sp.]
MFRIRPRKTPGQLVKDELGESFDHFVRAATHAANGVGAKVGPRVVAARALVGPTAERLRRRAVTGWESAVATLTPLVVAAADQVRQASEAAARANGAKRTRVRRTGTRGARSRWPMIAGLLALGAAAGTVGLVLRQRRAANGLLPEDGLATMPDDMASPETLVGQIAAGTVSAAEGSATAAASATGAGTGQ